MNKLLAILCLTAPLYASAYTLLDLEKSIKDSDSQLCSQIVSSDITITQRNLNRLVSLSESLIEKRKSEYSFTSPNYLLWALGYLIGGSAMVSAFVTKVHEIANYMRQTKLYDSIINNQSKKKEFEYLFGPVEYSLSKPQLSQALANRTTIIGGIGIAIVTSVYVSMYMHIAQQRQLYDNAIEIKNTLLRLSA